jgi:Membrane protein involved in the export of O-antigen and teichoic acid
MNSTNKKLINNFLSLAILQGTNYILPLITFPYLVRVLGPAHYGLIAFSQAFITYFIVLTDYGFNLTATRQIAVNKSNKENVRSIFSTVIVIKFIFAFVYFLLMAAIVFSIDKFREVWTLYFITYGMVIGNVLFPIWFFQGMEQMKYITLLNIGSKFISTAAIFIFVRNVNDFLYVPLINSVSVILFGIISIILIFRVYRISFSLRYVRNITKQLYDGWHVFISQIAINLYTASSTFILGLFTNNTIVGYYASGEKIVKAVQGLITPIAQTVYPHVNSLAAKSKELAFAFLKKLFLFISVSTLAISAILLLSADFLVSLILGNEYTHSIIIVKILSFLPFIVGLSNLFGIQTMLTFDMKKEFSRILVSAGIMSVILAFVFVPYFKQIGTAISVLLTESIITVAMFIVLYRRGYRFLGLKRRRSEADHV